MSKDLLKELKKVYEEFRYEPDLPKRKAREIYKVCLKAFQRIDYLQSLLDAYKAPTLLDKSVSQGIPQRTYLSRAERIEDFLAVDPDGESEAFQQFLKWNQLSLSQAKELVYTAMKVK